VASLGRAFSLRNSAAANLPAMPSPTSVMIALQDQIGLKLE
jgi:hypothetical protein